MPPPSWKLRRRAVFGSLIFGACIVTYVALRGQDTALAETLALGGFGLMAAVVAAYTGTATWEDIGLRRNKIEPAPTPTEEVVDVH